MLSKYWFPAAVVSVAMAATVATTDPVESSYTVFNAADAADFALNRDALAMRDRDDLFGLLHVLINIIVGTVEHN